MNLFFSPSDLAPRLCDFCDMRPRCTFLSAVPRPVAALRFCVVSLSVIPFAFNKKIVYTTPKSGSTVLRKEGQKKANILC